MPKTLPIHFAPLQGYTEVFYRNAHAACFGGIDTYYTPFVRLEKGGFRHRDVRGIEPGNNQVAHLIPQLIAPFFLKKQKKSYPYSLKRDIRKSTSIWDVLFPCWLNATMVPGILPYPEEVQALLSLITEYPQISFSIKMRLGWEDPEECLKLAPIINELPLRQVVMHPRLGKQQYKGEVDLKAFEAFQNACKHPLIYNGDINSVEDIHRIQEQFPGLAGMMIGRGLLANPALALEYRQNRALEFDEMREKLQSMHKCVYNQYAEQLEGGDEQLLNKMKTFWEYLMPQADRKLLKAIHKSTSLNKYNQAILVFFNQR